MNIIKLTKFMNVKNSINDNVYFISNTNYSFIVSNWLIKETLPLYHIIQIYM